MSIVPSITIQVNGSSLPTDLIRVLQSLEIENSVHAQSIFRMKFAIGQDQGGDWASGSENSFTPMTPVTFDCRLGQTTQRIMNGYLTEFKMNFNSDPCQSMLELVGMDALEWSKRNTQRQAYPNQSIRTIVSQVLQRNTHVVAPLSVLPDTGIPNQNRQQTMQSQNDLEFLRALADTVNSEVYVEPLPAPDSSQGHFEPLSISQTSDFPTLLFNQGARGHVMSASFFYDLSGPTAVEAQNVDAQGRALATPVRVALRDQISDADKRILGPPGFENVQRIEPRGRETTAELRRLCETELEKHSWVVIGRGELDGANYGSILTPRKSVDVKGVSKAFDGTYLVWKVTHTFSRDLYCQKFELRRKLGVN
jgi:hypothetical protein